jgi:ATP-grasp domain
MGRRTAISRIHDALRGRKLVWFGTRGTDAIPLLELGEFADCYSLIAPVGSLSLEREVSLETLSSRRVDLDTYTIDNDRSDEAEAMHRAMLRSLAMPSALMVYRPCSFITSIYFSRRRWIEYLGMFHERQSAFEHKPWVETELTKAGISVVPWQYFPDEDQTRVLEALKGRALVLRTSRSDGGVGLRVVREPEELVTQWPEHSDRFVAAAPYYEKNIPLNVGVCVHADGSISLHGPSLQLIGVPGLTNLPLGYCGNDFARVADLDDEILDNFEKVATEAGRWLASQGYLGAFGVDAIATEGRVYLTEINPRFQGSSAMSAELDLALDRPDIFLCHAAAFLDLDQPEPLSLRQLAREQPARSQLVVHNIASEPTTSRDLARPSHDRGSTGSLTAKLQAAPGVSVMPGGTLLRLVSDGSVTPDGFCIEPSILQEIEALVDSGYQRPVAQYERTKA